MKHLFESNNIDMSVLLAKPTLRALINALKAQAETLRAKELWALKSYYDKFDQNEDASDESDFCPEYFGAGFDWFGTSFLQYFGEQFNVYDVRSLLEIGCAERDIGIDAHAKSAHPGCCKTLPHVKWGSGSPAPLQFKGSVNLNAELELNKSRLGNFGTAVRNLSLISGTAYATRMIVFTSAKDVNAAVKRTFGETLEVIGSNEISKLADNNIPFWNSLRAKFDLAPLSVKINTESDPV